MRKLWASPRCVLAEAKKLRDEDEQQRKATDEEARAERRGYARHEAKTAELIARTDPDRAALARHSARLPGFENAIAQVVDLYRTPVIVGWSVGDRRYSCGVPLVNDRGVLLAVFDPLPQPGPCPAFLLDVGLPLYFPTEEQRERFEQYRAVSERIRASYSTDLD
ncbi:hypothetical protein [Streptomyces sp. NPDC058142]|uniref:hypothetical protein n=1 Tax=Streptomyces sp. NPDC058142 TaxID=3346355 RepID=UPI0036EF06F3